MTIDKTKDAPGVEEQRRMTEEMNQRIRDMGECVWVDAKDLDNNPLWSSKCGQESVFDNDGPIENEYKFCPYCGGKLVVK